MKEANGMLSEQDERLDKLSVSLEQDEKEVCRQDILDVSQGLTIPSRCIWLILPPLLFSLFRAGRILFVFLRLLRSSKYQSHHPMIESDKCRQPYLKPASLH